MIDYKILKRLMKCFPDSFINDNFEFIYNIKQNTFFRLEDVETELDLKCKILYYISYHADRCISHYEQSFNNKKLGHFYLNGINKFLGTKFTSDKINVICNNFDYEKNRELCIKFIESGYDMKLLEEQK